MKRSIIERLESDTSLLAQAPAHHDAAVDTLARDDPLKRSKVGWSLGSRFCVLFSVGPTLALPALAFCVLRTTLWKPGRLRIPSR
jgi:hypothetical protein